MSSFTFLGLREAYRKIEQLRDKLSGITKLIDWEAFRPQIEDMHNSKTEKGGRPNFDVILLEYPAACCGWDGHENWLKEISCSIING